MVKQVSDQIFNIMIGISLCVFILGFLFITYEQQQAEYKMSPKCRCACEPNTVMQCASSWAICHVPDAGLELVEIEK